MVYCNSKKVTKEKIPKENLYSELRECTRFNLVDRFTDPQQKWKDAFGNEVPAVRYLVDVVFNKCEFRYGNILYLLYEHGGNQISDLAINLDTVKEVIRSGGTYVIDFGDCAIVIYTDKKGTLVNGLATSECPEH